MDGFVTNFIHPVTDRRPGRFGFTLIELMIVVAIIGILASIAITKLADLVRKSKEGATKGSLGALRSSLSIYYSDMEGLSPLDFVNLTINGKYLAIIPYAKIPDYHADNSTNSGQLYMSGFGPAIAFLPDVGGWAYGNGQFDPLFGLIVVNCSQTDTKGTVWTNY